MAGKSGKRVHCTGRTVRSPYARRARREGILIKKVRETSENSEETQAEDLVSTINYSLGKQNRWLMPEIIKHSVNPHEVVGEESDFLLVEQRGAQVGRKPRCISIYDSSTRRIRKPKRRYLEASSLRSELNEADLEFEVQYPVGKGSWPLNSEVKYSEKCRGKRKASSKNRRGKWSKSFWREMVEEEGYFSHEDEEEEYDDDVDSFDGEYYDGDDNDDDRDDRDDSMSSKHHSLYTSLGEYVLVNEAEQPCIQRKSHNKAIGGQTKCSSKDNIIVIDNKDFIHEHNALLRKAKARNSFIHYSLKSRRGCPENLWSSRKRLKYRRNKAQKQYAILEKEDYESDLMTKEPSIESKQSLDFTPETYPSCEVSLRETDILPSELQRTWGEDYTEGCSVPRKFAIDLTGLMKTSSKDIDLAVMVVLFELKTSEAKASLDICKASVKLLLHDGLSELNSSEETTELIKREFLDLLRDHHSGVCSVSEIINAGVKSIEKYGIPQDQMPSRTSEKKPFYTSNVFAEVLGYQGRSCTEKELLIQAKQELRKKDGDASEGSQVFSTCKPETECGICFGDLDNEGSQNHTTLVSCGHSFCNSCWEVYIKSMLSMGGTDLLCPGHQCQTSLDDITIMSLAPSWYGKYFSWKIKKSITKNPALKHCPSEVCHLLMQVLPCEVHKVPKKSTTAPLPVVCACNQSWCFKCQEPAHWPSSCEEAQKFRDENKEYLYSWKFMRDKGKVINSVMVKKCPTCSYPIEKSSGCNHMICSLCDAHFCWQCLSTMKNHNYYGCIHKEISKSEVNLPEVSKTNTQALTDIALSSHHAQRSKNIIAVQRQLKSMEQGINAYCYLKSTAFKNTPSSRHTSILEGMIKHNTLMHVKDALNFKSQAHVALEGLAIILLKGGKHCDKTLQYDLMRLVFIIEGLDNLLQNPCSVCNEEAVSKLTELIRRGKLFIRSIKRHVKK